MRKPLDTDLGDPLIDLAPQERGSPERSLLQALVLDAWSSCLVARRSRQAQMVALEAMRWVEGRISGPFAFDTVCEYLGLDSREARRRFRQLNNSVTAKASRVRTRVDPQLGKRKIKESRPK